MEENKRVLIMKGEKISLGLPEKEDIQMCLEGVNNLDINSKLFLNRSIVYRKDEEKYFEDFSNKNSGDRHFAIIENKSGNFIGMISYHSIDFINRNAVLGIAIFSDKHHGKGYGGEAIKLLLEYGFDFLNLHKVCLQVRSFNASAIKLYEKVGFKICGTLKEHILYKNHFYDEIYMEIFRSDLVLKTDSGVI